MPSEGGGERAVTSRRSAVLAVIPLARSVYGLASERQLSLLAAAIAYYAFVSMVPMVVLGLAVAATVGGDGLSGRLLALAAEVLTPAGQEVLRTALDERAGLGGVTVVGTVVLVWGAIKAFRALDRAFSLVYGSTGDTPVDTIVNAAVALAAVGLAVVVMLTAGAAVALLPGPLVGPVGALSLVLTLVAVFLPLYYLFPGVDVSVGEVLPGAALAAVGWTALGAAFQLYTTLVAGATIYGLLGAVLLVLTWFYLGALVLLLGAAVNAVRSGHAPVDR